MAGKETLGIVVIGRNEGERLRVCLRSVLARGFPVVFVDSDSLDGSASLAREMGADVIELDPARMLSAARARNEGFAHLLSRFPQLRQVQFVDGDCELIDGWLEKGAEALDADGSVSGVCGRVMERNPDANVYKRMVAIEWRKVPGPVAACGGNFMVRAEAFRREGGFRPEVIAAEDDELCFRLRQAGGRILHIDAGMVWHEIAMTRLSEWLRRAQRTGHAYAQVAALHGRSKERLFVRDCLRAGFWGLALPVVSLALAWPTKGLSLLLLAAYPLQAARVYSVGRRAGRSRTDALLFAVLSLAAKFPAAAGMVQYHWRRRRGSAMAIIEHKGSGGSA
jgi:GT2 family glycosyltransferase